VLQAIADALGNWPSVYPHPDPPSQAGEGVSSDFFNSPADSSGACPAQWLKESSPSLAGEG
jgi:hypothetical protein